MRLVGLRERFGSRAPIPYVQDAILNRGHPYIVIATAIIDTTHKKGCPLAHVVCY